MCHPSDTRQAIPRGTTEGEGTQGAPRMAHEVRVVFRKAQGRQAVVAGRTPACGETSHQSACSPPAGQALHPDMQACEEMAKVMSKSCLNFVAPFFINRFYQITFMSI